MSCTIFFFCVTCRTQRRVFSINCKMKFLLCLRVRCNYFLPLTPIERFGLRISVVYCWLSLHWEGFCLAVQHSQSVQHLGNYSSNSLLKMCLWDNYQHGKTKTRHPHFQLFITVALSPSMNLLFFVLNMFWGGGVHTKLWNCIDFFLWSFSSSKSK